MEENKEIKEETASVVPEKEEPVKENTPPGKNNKGLVIALVVIILLLVASLIYLLFFNKDKEPSNDDNPPTQVTPTPEPTDVEPAPTDEPEDKGDYELTVYKEKDSGYLSDANKKDEYLEKAFTINVKTNKAKIIAVDYRNMVLYEDDGLYVYNNKTKKSQKINLENSYKTYVIYTNEDNNQVIGIGYLDKNDTYGYYNVTKDKKLYQGKYKLDDIWSASQINDHYLSLHSGTTAYLLSTDSESVKLSYKDPDAEESTLYSYFSFGSNGNYIFALGFYAEPSIIYERFYANDYKKFYEANSNISIQDENIFYKDYLYFAEGNYENGFNKILKYNTKGELVATYSNYNDIKMLSKGYVVYVNEDNLTLTNIENTSETKVLIKMDGKKSVDTLDSGYYTREDLDAMGETNKKEGLYVVIDYGYDDNGNIIKDSKGYYGMEYCYTPDKQVVEYPIKEEKGGRAKPVLYLYPTKETKVTVTFAHSEYLTTTYPKYLNSWSVTAKPNGDLRDSDGKYYYALYWDETRYSEVDFKEGFYVEGKDAINFLEEKLTIIGLSDKERNEFIMYWLPIMEANDKNLVYFELTNEREANNKLFITPKPDSLLRVSIHIKKINEKVNIKEQKLETFTRSGFTAVEWGGMTY